MQLDEDGEEFPDAKPYEINPEKSAQLLRDLMQPTRTPGFIYNVDGAWLADSSKMYANGQLVRYDQSVYRSDEEGMLYRLWLQMESFFRQESLPLFKEGGLDGKVYAEVKSALEQGSTTAMVRVNEIGETILSVAAPIHKGNTKGRPVLGAVLLTTAPGEIDSNLLQDRLSLMKLVLLVLLVAAAASVILAGTIAGPMHRLARAAQHVRNNIEKREEIPPFAKRKDEIGLWGRSDKQLRIFKKLRIFDGPADTGYAIALSADGRTALSGGSDKKLMLWDVATGKKLRTLRGHTDTIHAVAFSADGRTALSGSSDATTRLWDVGKERELARIVSTGGDIWLTITPEGFFTSSHRDTALLAITRGLETTAVGQVYQSLYNPDLVREALAGDPNGEVQRAAGVISLEKVLDAGPPPAVAIASHAEGSRSSKELVTLTVRIKDRGKGIGRIEWRVNGITVGVSAAPAKAGANFKVKHELALDPGKNQIEVIAYERRNLIASPPARATITYDSQPDSVKPKLHILAIGINKYVDQGSSKFGHFPPLGLAVADAKAFGAEMKKAGAGIYSDVIITETLDTDATPKKLENLIERLATSISPRDTFVLYVAAHGFSHNGRFYIIPQDFQGGPDPKALAKSAIGQDRIQHWIANRIKAKKAIILLDTCESGALTQGYSRSRVDRPASEAAIGRLHEATGRPVLTAAAEGQDALEITKLGHGVFTSALIDALYKGDSNGNGLIEVSELATHVQNLVPKLVNGGLGRSAIARGNGKGKQSARFGTTGSDFALVKRQQ
jgi:HAMP domain-containing protein